MIRISYCNDYLIKFKWNNLTKILDLKNIWMYVCLRYELLLRGKKFKREFLKRTGFKTQWTHRPILMLNHNLSLHPSKCSSTMTCFKVNENTVLFLHYQFPLAVWMYIPKSRWIGWTKIIGNDFHQKDLRKWKPNIETARLVQNNLEFSHYKYQINNDKRNQNDFQEQ